MCQIHLDGTPLRKLRINDPYRYLGIDFSTEGKVPTSSEVASTILGNIGRTPIQPVQKIRCLVQYGIPKLLHRLVLGRVSAICLRRLKPED